MDQAGLIEAVVGPRNDNDPPFVMVRDLTWAGHDLANVLANDNVWAQMKKKLSPADLATIPLSVIKDIGVALIGQLVKAQFGLPS